MGAAGLFEVARGRFRRLVPLQPPRGPVLEAYAAASVGGAGGLLAHHDHVAYARIERTAVWLRAATRSDQRRHANTEMPRGPSDLGDRFLALLLAFMLSRSSSVLVKISTVWRRSIHS